MHNKFKVLGLMSGTSLDGLDLACCQFLLNDDKKWSYEIEVCETIPYPKKWQKGLAEAATLPTPAFLELDSSYGTYLGEAALSFLSNHKKKVDFISSHGHTVFHQPSKNFTCQIGNGNAIHAATNIPVVFDFRSLDVALNGQGAPLVPVGDQLLFSEYDCCLNIGGIANLSRQEKNRRIAFDICFANMAFNFLMNERKKSFDNRGATAASGTVNKELLRALTSVYKRYRPKRPSLGKEMFDEQILPLIRNKKISLEDRLASCVEAAAQEIVLAALPSKGTSSLLCTGGGAYNSFLISRILDIGGDSLSIIIPDDNIVKFKEALIFAFLGVLRVSGINNCLSSVTGAKRDNCGGLLAGFKINDR